MNVFQSNACPVCGKYGRDANLKRCANCRMIGYCSREHQREHWPFHKDVCKVLGNRIKQNGSVFPPKGEEEIIDMESWYLRKQKLMSFVQSQLGRRFLLGEAEMLIYARSCEVCHETNPQELVDCANCPSASFCKKHTNAEHQENCKLSKLVEKMKSELPGKPHKFSMLNIGTNIPEDLEGVANCYREHYRKNNSSGIPTETWFLANMEKIWRPYTFLHCVQKISMSIFPLNIHILANDVTDILTVAGWEVLLHHTKLSKDDVVITFIGPELNDHEKLAQFGKKRKILVNTVRKSYQDYVNSHMYTKPNVIVGFNIAVHVLTYDWAPTIKEIEKLKCPFFITAMTKMDIEKDQNKINSVLDKDANSAYFGKNPYHGLAPIFNPVTQEITQSGLYLMIYENL